MSTDWERRRKNRKVRRAERVSFFFVGFLVEELVLCWGLGIGTFRKTGKERKYEVDPSIEEDEED